MKTEHKTARRRFYIFTRVFFRIILDFRKESILIKSKGYGYAREKMLERHEKRARDLFNAAIGMRGALIKLCQFLSTRVDILPEPYIRILKPLQDNVPPVEFSEIEKVIKTEYNDYSSFFREIDRSPLASASLAQVHKAVLNSGETVVLKILKPDIERIIDTDFAIIHHVFKLFSHFKFFREHFRFNEVLEDFITVTGDELNFKREAYIAAGFRKNFQKFQYIIIPKIYEKYSTKKIIVMEYLQADKITAMDQWQQRNNDPSIIVKRLIEFYVEQIFYTDFIHFDPHPGNILIFSDNRIGIVDFGMSGITTEEMRTGLWEILDSFLKKDAERLTDALDKSGFFVKGFNKYLFMPVLEFIFDEIYSLFEKIRLSRESIHTGIREIDFKPVINNLIRIIYTNSITLPANWVYIGKTLGSIAGIISSLDPDFRIFSELKLHVNEFIKRNYSYLVKKYLKMLSSNLNTLITLPDKTNEFISKIESGKINIKVDYEEVMEKIDEFKGFVIKLSGLFIFLFSGLASYISFLFGYMNIFILFLIISCLSLIVVLFYRKKSGKDEIRSQMEKMI